VRLNAVSQTTSLTVCSRGLTEMR